MAAAAGSDAAPAATEAAAAAGSQPQPQQQQQQQQGSSGHHSSSGGAVPEMVRQFVVFLRNAVREGNVLGLQQLYDRSMNRITDKFYKNQPWPTIAEFGEHREEVFGSDATFELLYQQLYYRHLYVHTVNPSMEQRVASWGNYVALFDALLAVPTAAEAKLELPLHWTWDIIDEFLYQYEAFSTYRARLINKSPAELRALGDIHAKKAAWDTGAVMSYLSKIVEKSNILDFLAERKAAAAAGVADQVETDPTAAQKPSEPPKRFADLALYRMLGYFAIVGQLRIHVLTGNFTSALEVAGPLELNDKRALHALVPVCYVNLYFFLSLAFMMLYRFADASRALTHILQVLIRTRNVNSLRGGTTYHHDIIQKKSEQCFALLAICTSLWPTRVDDAVHPILREKHGEKTQRLHRGEITLAELVDELWRNINPKFLVGEPTWDYEAAAVQTEEKEAAAKEAPPRTGPMSPAEHAAWREAQAAAYPLLRNHTMDYVGKQRAALVAQASVQQTLVTIRSYLKLYTAISVDKLASFLDLSPEDLRVQLETFTKATRAAVWIPGHPPIGAPAEATASSSISRASGSDINFEISDDGMIRVAGKQSTHTYTELFLRHIDKFGELTNELNAAPTPGAAAAAAAAAAAPTSAAAAAAAGATTASA